MLSTFNELKNIMSNENIIDIIERFNIVNKERKELNSTIKNYYEPLLSIAGNNKDKAKFDELLSEIPECPFLMTAYRMADLHDI